MKHILKKPIKVSVKGEFEEVHELQFRAPSYKELDEAAAIEQFMSRAMFSLAEKAQGADDGKDGGEITAEAIGFLVNASDQDITVLYQAFGKLVKKVCTVYEGISMSQGHLEQIDINEFKAICFKYVANFTMPSLMSGAK